MTYLIVLVGYVALCLINGKIAERKLLLGWRPRIGRYEFRPGFWLTFWVSLLLFPSAPVVFLVLLVIPTRMGRSDARD